MDTAFDRLVPACYTSHVIYTEILLVVATWALVWVTFRMARQQTAILREQAETLRTDLKVRLQLTFTDRFDALQMQEDRKKLAESFLSNAPHDQIQEAVLNFFEDMGCFLRRGYLDEDLLWRTFGFYAVRWWAICKDYVLVERKLKNDSTLFEDFEYLAERLHRCDVKAGLAEPSTSELKTFLEDELNL